VKLEDLAVQDPEPETLLGFLEEMEFKTITRRVREMMEKEGALEAAPPTEDPIDRTKYACVRDFNDLEGWVASRDKAGYVAVDTETDSLDSVTANLVGVSLALAPNEACYIPLAHVDPNDAGDGDMFGADPPRQIRMKDAINALKPLLEDDAVLKIGRTSSTTEQVAQHGIQVAPIDDTMLLSYALNAGKHGHGMDMLSEKYLGHTPHPFKDVAGSGKIRRSPSTVAIDKAAPTPPRMPTSRCACGRRSSRFCTGEGDDGLRDAGTPAGASARAHGARGHQGRPDMLSRLSRLRATHGGAGSGDL
jgi:DNA polymerase-1